MIGLGILRCVFLGTLMMWYTASVWQTVDRYFRDQFKDYLEKEYEENVEVKKDVMMEKQREAARKALIERMAKIQFEKALDRQAELAKKTHQQQFVRTEEAMFKEEQIEEQMMQNQALPEEDEVCSEEGDRGGTGGFAEGTHEGVTMVTEEGMGLVNDGFDPMSESEVGTLENDVAWVTTGADGETGSEVAAGTDETVEEELEPPTGAEDEGKNWETERIIAEMQSEYEAEFEVWKPGGCESESSTQEECGLEDFAEVEQDEEVDKKWRSVFEEDAGEMCLINSAEERGSCFQDIENEGERVFIKRPFGN